MFTRAGHPRVRLCFCGEAPVYSPGSSFTRGEGCAGGGAAMKVRKPGAAGRASVDAERERGEGLRRGGGVVEQRGQEPLPRCGGAGGLPRQLIAQGQQFVHFGDDPLLFGEGRDGHNKAFNISNN